MLTAPMRQIAAPLSPAVVWSGLLGLAALLFILAYGLARRRNSRRSLIRRIAELEALAEAGRAIVASELDLMALCELIADETGKVIDNSTFQIGLFEQDFYRMLFWRIRGEKQATPRIFDLHESIGLVGWVRDHGQPLLIKDYQEELADLPARPIYISRNPSRSAIFVPLISGGEVIGVMAAQHAQPNRFKEDDVRRLSILANQAAAGIANARLFEQVRARAEDLEMISRISRRVNAIHDMDDIFQEVVVLARDRLGFHPVNILSLDPDTQELVVRASSISDINLAMIRLRLGEGLSGAAAVTRQTVLVNDVAEDARYLASIGIAEYDEVARKTQAEIAIPLMVDETVLGVLDVQSERPDGFTQREQAVLEAMANEVAAAIQKARQLAAQRQQAWITTAQLQVADTIGRSRDLDELGQAITRLAPLLVGVVACGLWLWDGELSEYQPVAVYGLSALQSRRWLERRLASGDWPSLDAVHVGRQEFTAHVAPPWTAPDDPRPVSLWPLLAQGRRLGVMFTQGPELDTDTRWTHEGAGRRHELLRHIADQTAQAMASLRLRLAQQEEAWVNTALLQVAEAVNSLIDLNEILGTIVRLVPMLVGVRTCLALIWDEGRRVYRVGASYGVSEMALGVLESFGLEASEFSFSQAYDHYTLSPGTQAYRVRLPGWLNRVFQAEEADGIPLQARGKLVGALLVGDPEQTRPLSGRRLRILAGIAQQAAIAVANDQLYKESAERQRLDQELRVAFDIQASLIPSDNPAISGCDVAGYWQAARQVSGDFYDYLELPNGRWGIVIADVTDKGVPAALFMALCRTIIRTVAFNRVDPALVLDRANDIILNDTASDLFVTVFYAIYDPHDHTLTYANGGHNPPLLIGQDEQVRLLKEHGLVLGVVGNLTFQSHQVTLKPGDVVVFYTDGVTEAVNETDAEFGLERLRRVVLQARQASAVKIVEAIMAAVQSHAGDTAQFDDSTLVVMKYLGEDIEASAG